MILKEQRDDGTVLVRFRVPAAFKVVAVVGDFNRWDPAVTPFRCAGDSSTASAIVPMGRRYTFRYVTASGSRCNDEAADDYEADELSAFCGVLDLTQSFAGVGGGT